MKCTRAFWALTGKEEDLGEAKVQPLPSLVNRGRGFSEVRK